MSNKTLDNFEKRISLLYEVDEEREKQDEKWGEQNHQPIFWCAILGEEVGEINKAALEHSIGKIDLEEYRKELIQTAAVCFSMLECLDRNTKNKFTPKTIEMPEDLKDPMKILEKWQSEKRGVKIEKGGEDKSAFEMWKDN